MHQGDAIGEETPHLLPGYLPDESHRIGDAELPGQRLEPGPLWSLTDDPVLGIWQSRLFKSTQGEVDTLPVQ